TRVDPADLGVAVAGRVVGDHVTVLGEADDGHQVARGAVAGAVERGLVEGLGRDQRDAGRDARLGVGVGGDPGERARWAWVGRGVGDGERRVVAALGVVVVGVAGGVADRRVGVVGVDPRQVLLAGPAPPVLEDRLGGGRAAPGLAAVVVLRVLADVDV